MIRQRLARWLLGMTAEQYDQATALLLAPLRAAGRDPKVAEQLKQFRQWVYAAVSVRANRVASAPLMVWRAPVGGLRREWEELPNHIIARTLGSGGRGRPNPIYSSFNFRRITQIDLDLTGNAFWYLVRDRLGVPVQFWRLRPDRVRPVVRDGQLVAYEYLSNGKARRIDTDDIIHFRYPSPLDDYWGWSPLRAAALSVSLDENQRIYQREFFASGTQLGTTLVTDQPITPKQAEEIAERVELKRRGPVGAWRLAIFGMGLKPVPTTVTNRDIEATGLLELTRDDVLAIYGVPLSKLGKEERTGLTRATAEAADVTFARETILPLLRNIQEQLEADLLPQYPAPPGYTYEVRFELDVPRDREADLQEEVKRLQEGVFVINEVRNKLGLKSVPWGDRPWLPVNRMQVTDAEAEPAPAPPPEDGAKGWRWTDEAVDRIWHAWDRRLERHEPALLDAVRRRFRAQEELAQEALQRPGAGPREVAFAAAGPAEGRKLADALLDASKTLVAGEVAAWLDTLGAENAARQDEPHPKVDALAAATLAEWSELAMPVLLGITDTTWRHLVRTLEEGYALGESLEELAARVSAVYEQADLVRATRIVRTYTTGLGNFTGLKVQKSDGWRRKRWVTARDEAVRDAHASDGEGQVVAINEPFIVGGEELMFPGDPQASAENTVNCRCLVLPAR